LIRFYSVIVTLSLFSLLSCYAEVSADYFQLSLFPRQTRQDTYLLNLLREPDNDNLVEKSSFEESRFDFAFSSQRVLKKAFSHFLLDRERNESFLRYQVVDESISAQVRVSLTGGIDYHTDFDKSYINLYRGVLVRGNIHNRLVFWGNWWAARFEGDLDYVEETSPLFKGFYKNQQDHGQTGVNKVSGQISYLFPFGDLSLGRGTHLIGDNIGGSIILNDEVNDYGYFSAKVDFGKLTLSFLHASLIPFERDFTYDYRAYVQKHMALHQIDYRPRHNLKVFFGEHIVYANRGVEVSYLLPHTFNRFIEHNLRDRDNVHIYAGGRWDVSESVGLYGNFILGELKKSEFLGDWWGNKYALQGGIDIFYLEGLFQEKNRPVNTTLEFTAIRPWLYTHSSTVTAFTHDRRGWHGSAGMLGFPEGTNLVQVAAEISVPVLPYLTFDQFASFTRQGDLGDGSELDYNNRPKDTAKWLEGEQTDTLRGKTVLTFSLFAHHSVKAGVDWRKDDGDWKHELMLSYQAMY
jgi:hypothetical protein